MRARLMGAILGLALLATVVLPPVAAEAATGPRSGFELSSKWFGSGGWRWSISASMGTDRMLSLIVIARQRLHEASAPQQRHDWTFQLPSDDLMTGHADLLPTTLDTGTDLGRFGTIDISLESATTLTSRPQTCPTTGAVVGRIRSRRGTLAGTFDFKPGPGMPADVAPTSVQGRIRKLTETTNPCDDGTTTGCPVQTDIAAFSATDDRAGTLYAIDSPRRSSISFDDVKTFARGTRVDSMFADVPPGAAVVSGGTAVVHSKPFGSWADGTIHLTLGAAHPHHISPTCVRTFYDTASQSGGITVHFATGDAGFTTPFPRGIGVTIVAGT